MATMTVARALAKLKTMKKKMDKIIEDIGLYGGINSMQLSPLSTNKDIETNHKEAREAIASKIKSYNDLLKNYTVLYTKIQEANNHNTIQTERYGEITVATALVLTGRLLETVKNFAGAMGTAAATAERSASQFNKNLTGRGVGFPSDMVSETLFSQPEVLIAWDEIERAKSFPDEIREINDLVNECNALSTIEVDE
ncbi:MAG: hypothetical protein Q4D21_04860 [Phascolarctobacterium sp.]|nr:hypothetical protein [Phascolarctobacterium sp.]